MWGFYAIDDTYNMCYFLLRELSSIFFQVNEGEN